MQKTILFFLVGWALSFSVEAQPNNNRMGGPVLPSPEAAALGKYGDVPVSHFTGVPNVSVPIYSLKSGSLSLDIQLSNHPSGIRVAEAASWVGTGWSLHAGGMISRTVQGIEDELIGGYLSNGNSLQINGGCVTHPTYAQPVTAMADAQLDGEPDIFSYSVAGFSGKFYLDASGNAVQVPKSDLKIEYALDGSGSNPLRFKTFTLTLPDGTKYQYGNVGSSTDAIEIARVNGSVFWSANNWKLKKIESADGLYWIDFNYAQERYSYPMRQRNGFYTSNGYRFNLVEIQGARLTAITPSTGRETVSFVAETTQRLDLFAPFAASKSVFALDYITVASTNSSFCKKFDFDYEYFHDNTTDQANNEADYRLKLNSVQEKNCDNTLALPPYTFLYQTSPVSNPNYFATSLSADIDHWGYYNGQNFNKNYFYNIPFTEVSYTSNGQTIKTYEGGSNREPSSTASRLGSLKKIIYPTGGSTTFTLEDNTSYQTRTFNGTAPYDFLFSQNACSNAYIPFESGSILFPNVDLIYFELIVKPAGSGPGSPCCDGFIAGSLQAIVHATNTPINNPLSFYGSCTPVATNDTIKGKLTDLFPGIQSNIHYHFNYNLLKIAASLKFYLSFSEVVTGNLGTGGLRVAEITHHDGISTANDIVKTYNYDDPNIPGRSSGKLYNFPQYSFIYNGNSSPCNALNGSFITHFWFDQSIVPLSSFEGYHIGYESVREYVSGAGYTQYTYFVEPPDLYTTFPYPPPRAGVTTGNMSTQSLRNAVGDAKKYSVNTPKNDAYENSTGTIIKAYWAQAANNTPIALWKPYQIKTRPFRLASVEQHLDGLSTNTAYTYRSDQAHLLPVQITTTHPDGTVEQQDIQYAADLNQTDLSSRHIIHVPLESQHRVNTVWLRGQKTNYGLFSGFPRPQTLQSYNPALATWETETTFNGYDGFGNPRQITQRGWNSETFAWDKDLLTQRDFLAFQWKYDYHPNTALLQKYTEPNGLFSTYGYDALSRLTATNQYNGKAITTLGYSYGTGTSKITTSTAYASGPTLTTENEFDGLGRPTYSRKIGYGSGNQNVVSRVEYDNAGRIKKQYLPGFTSPGAFTEYTYENSSLNRPATITPPAPLGSSTLAYGNDNNQWTQTTTNALSEYKKTWTDSRGRTRQTQIGKAALINTTNYEYDNRDNLQTVLPHGRLITDTDHIYSYTYDGRNRLTAKKLPEKALMQMTYDLRDLPTHSKDGLHPVVYSVYDDYGRPTKTGFVPNLTSTSISNTLTETFYKTTAGAGFGQPYKTTAALLNNNGAPTTDFIAREIITFDTYHRPTEFKSNHPLSLTDLSAITGQTAFNGLDQATSLTTNVTANAITYSTTQSHLYDHGARLKKRDFSFNNTTVTADEITSFDAFDNPLQTKIGGNLQTVDYSYLSNGFLDKINGGNTNTGGLGLTDNGTPDLNSADDLFAMDLDYLQNGNISEWKQQNRGFALQTYAYTYDGLQRIKTAGNGTHQETFDYRDPLGNFSDIVRSDLVKSGGNWTLQTVDNLSFTYANTKTNRISSIADASNNANGYIPNAGAYSYDGNGNTTFDPSRGLNLTNNFLNLPSKFTKADGSRQEIIYDAGGHKWQEKTYGANNGILLGQKTYLENMEFEGNELSLVHHPTGFIRKLNSANHLSGILNGDAQGKTITSTQKIGDGRYTATDQVTLLPGFEASAKDEFLAKIGTVNTYQWQYVLTDHLGNQRALFTDKNNDGNIRQSADESLNEVLALRNYSAFGLELGGSQQNINYQNAYKYTGKEENSFTGYYDFGARWSDPTIGNRFLQLDEYAEKYYPVSPYAYVANMPLIAIDPDGRDMYAIIDGKAVLAKRAEGEHTFYNDGQKIDPFGNNWSMVASALNQAGRATIEGLGDSEQAKLLRKSVGIYNAMQTKNTFNELAGDLVGYMELIRGVRYLAQYSFRWWITRFGDDVAEEAVKGVPALRAAYEAEVKGLSSIAAEMRTAGSSSEQIARALHSLRRELGVKYKALTPNNLLQQIYQRNLQKYGDKLGPSIDYLRQQGKSWDDIINSATRPGGKDLKF